VFSNLYVYFAGVILGD